MRIGDVEILPVLDGTGREIAREVLSAPGEDRWSCHAEHLDADGVLRPAARRVPGAHRRPHRARRRRGRHDRQRQVRAAAGSSTRCARTASRPTTSPTSCSPTCTSTTSAGPRGRARWCSANATYRVHAADWAHFVDAPGRRAGSGAQARPRCATGWRRSTPTATLAPGLDARHTPGHTPGSTVYVVSDGDERALLLGDVVHSVVELAERGLGGRVRRRPGRRRAPCATRWPTRSSDTTDLVGRRPLPRPARSAGSSPPAATARFQAPSERKHDMDLQLAGTTVLVTGAGQGLGRAIGWRSPPRARNVAFHYHSSAEGAEKAAAEAAGTRGRRRSPSAATPATPPPSPRSSDRSSPSSARSGCWSTTPR